MNTTTRAVEVAQLITAALDGDQAAWHQLIDRFSPLVMTVMRRYRLSAEDAADVSQTVWLKLVQHIHKLREPRALPGWIVTTARNEAISRCRVRDRIVCVDAV